MIRKVLLVAGLAGAALGAGAIAAQAGGGGCHWLTEGTSTEISVEGNCFNAGIAYVDVGDTVTWTNNDSWTHNIAAANFPGTGDLSEPYQRTFTEAGIYPYACTLHWGMVGAVVVGEIAEPEVSALAVVPSADTPAGGSSTAIALAVGIGLGLSVVIVSRVVARTDPR